MYKYLYNKYCVLGLFASLFLWACNKNVAVSPAFVEDPALVHNSLVFEHQLYQARPKASGSFETDFTSVNTFELKESNAIKTLKLILNFPNSDPLEGAYSTEGYEDYKGQDIKTDNRKIQVGLEVDGVVYRSKDTAVAMIQIGDFNDSIEVTLESVPLYHNATKKVLKAKFMIAVKLLEPIATFMDGTADTLIHGRSRDTVYTYYFGNRKWKHRESVLVLKFSEPLTETRNYRVTHWDPAEGEVYIMVANHEQGYSPSPLFVYENTVYLNVVKQANGDFSFRFKDIESPGLFYKTLYGSGTIPKHTPRLTWP